MGFILNRFCTSTWWATVPVPKEALCWRGSQQRHSPGLLLTRVRRSPKATVGMTVLKGEEVCQVRCRGRWHGSITKPWFVASSSLLICLCRSPCSLWALAPPPPHHLWNSFWEVANKEVKWFIICHDAAFSYTSSLCSDWATDVQRVALTSCHLAEYPACAFPSSYTSHLHCCLW